MATGIAMILMGTMISATAIYFTVSTYRRNKDKFGYILALGLASFGLPMMFAGAEKIDKMFDKDKIQEVRTP